MLWANHKLRLIVTSACNLNCFYCHNEGQRKATDLLPIDLFEHILRLAHKYPNELERATLSGGEPLLHPQLEHFVRQLAPLTAHRTIVTNGLLLNGRRLESLRNAGVSSFRLGVDSLSSQRSRPSSVFPVEQSIHGVLSLLQKEGMPYELNVVLTDFNRREIPGILRYCRDHRVSAKFFEHVKTLPVQGETGVICAEAQPYVARRDFEQSMKNAIPSVVALPPDLFDGANDIYDCDGFTIRYCRYLCEYGLCYLTGTRIDPRGFVYGCLVGNGRFRISAAQELDESSGVIRAALEWGCSSRPRITPLVSV